MPPSIHPRPPTSSPEWTQASFESDIASKKHALGTSITSHPTSDPRASINGSSPSLQTQKASTSPDPNNTLHPPNAASPAFSFDDYLTPEFSSENPHSEQSHQTTPSADDLWHDDYKSNYPIPSQEVHPLDNQSHDTYFLSSAHNAFGSGQIFNESRSSGDNLTISNHALLTPEMSTASMTPERSIRPPQPADQLITHFDSPMTDRARPTNAYTARSPSQKRKIDGHDEQNVAQSISPVVMVSTYNRGDSPARSQVPLSRSNSRRSQSSRLGHQNNNVGENVASNQSSRLMPPINLEHENWGDDDDDDVGNGDDDHRSGVSPAHRNADYVSSANDLERQRELDEKSADVEHWLATSIPGSPAASDEDSRAFRSRKNRIRSRSTGTRVDAMGLQIFSDSHIPGPGILIDEDSNYYYSDGDEDDSSMLSSGHDAEATPESPPADVKPDEPAVTDGYFPPMDDDIAPEDDEPLPRQFIRQLPWQDPVRGPSLQDQSQPPTANAAMVIFSQRVAKFDTASRAATWGTRRRLSDSEIGSILDGSSMTRHLSLKDTLAERARARGSSILNSARKVLPGRSGSFIRKQQKQSSRQPSPEDKPALVTSPEPQDDRTKHRDSVGSTRQTGLRRFSSRGKSKPPKSPPLNTSSAFMAMTGNLTVMGGSSTHLTAEPETSRSPLLSALKRVRSKSEVSKSPKANHGLSDLFTKHGGPPAPLLASPLQMRGSSPRLSVGHEDDMDEDGADEDAGIKMDLPVQTHNVIPTLEGFKTHARQLNPRLEPYLIERIGQDQLKRFKRLVKNKVDHARAVQTNKCASGNQCLSMGGKATILPPRTNGKDVPSNFAQFKVAPGGESDNDESNFVEGVVTPALFPAGIPLPPTTHLPAQFECPLCFQVKKFQKPSDWTKHVHEDVQPFSCTFANCPEPKSFKRKADWVRHENERHRHLEWWKCSVQECAHVCYRKDNFVQHLVREHKMVEPKGKGSKSGSKRNVSASQGGDFWHVVDVCRGETSLAPKNEPCKFCGNVCNSWKKLSVHVGKHMEQIAMPVLNLAERQKVSAETIISPIEVSQSQTFPAGSIESKSLGAPEQYQHSPYPNSVHSNYQGSSAGHSPAVRPANPQIIASSVNTTDPSFYHQNMEPSTMQPVMVQGTQFPNGQTLSAHYPYNSYENMPDSEYISAHQHDNYGANMGQNMTTSYQAHQIPRSQPMNASYDSVTAMQGVQNSPYAQQASPVPYYGGHNSANGTYLATYGHNLTHQPEVIDGSLQNHLTHQQPPVQGPHTENGLAFYPPTQPGPSNQGYY